MGALALCACAPQQGPPPRAGGSAYYTYQVVNTYPHDPGAYTQGLLYRDGVLYEGTGLERQSSIRKVKLETGEVLQKRDVPYPYFGEGIAVWNGRLIELTWRGQRGFLYDLATFEPRGEFEYTGEGWGLTSDGRRIIMSDGTSQLRFLDPATLQETGGRIQVTGDRGPVPLLNELEWVKGEVYANVWKEERIACIDPNTGKISKWIDLRGLLPFQELAGPDNVPNGIAYDAKGDRLFVTGKRWPKLFEIRPVARSNAK